VSERGDIEELARLTIDAGLNIHKELGPGLFESVYEALLALKLTELGLSVQRQVPIAIEYEGASLGEGFRADLLVEKVLILEIKSVERLSPLHIKQLLTYLRLFQQPLGLLLNFGGLTFREGIKRVVNDHASASRHLRVNRLPIIQIE
jgi:iron complex transport system substrate-binding protein